MRSVLILKTGTTLDSLRARRGDFEVWIAAGLGLGPDRIEVCSVFEGAPLPAPDAPAAVVVTGSSAMVSEREPWSEYAAGWLANAVRSGTPVLGICYGHQLLAQALGGRVGPNPRGREIGSLALRATAEARDDALLAPLGRSAIVQTTHLESVLELPPGARRLATTQLDPNAAFAWGPSAWGVQFHPEFDAEIIGVYLSERSAEIRSEGLDPDALRAAATPSDAGETLLRTFAGLVEIPGVRE